MDETFMPDIGKNLVLYADGSAKPNPGKAGFGIHGYAYDYSSKDKVVKIDNWVITNEGYMTADALTDPNKKVETVVPYQYYEIVGNIGYIASNNVAELNAVISSLELAKQENATSVTIISDSEYTVKGINERCEIWRQRNWLSADGHVVANVNLWKSVYDLYTSLKEGGCSVTLRWTKGHVALSDSLQSDSLGNNMADLLANIASNGFTEGVSQNTIHKIDPKDYWKMNSEKSPFLNFRKVYFNSLESLNQPGCYYQAFPGEKNKAVKKNTTKDKDEAIGKRTPDAGYSIIRLKEPIENIEMIKNQQYNLSNGSNSIIFIKLDKVYNRGVLPYLERYGSACLSKYKRNQNMIFADDEPLTVEISPTGLSLRAIDYFNILDEMLDNFICKYDNTKAENSLASIQYRMFNYHDITSEFFTVKEKTVKKNVVEYSELNPELTNNIKIITLELEEDYKGEKVKLKFPIELGIDILPRNNLKKLEMMDPKIFLITWRESSESLSYACIIKTKDDIGIWANYFTNRIFLINFSKQGSKK